MYVGFVRMVTLPALVARNDFQILISAYIYIYICFGTSEFQFVGVSLFCHAFLPMSKFVVVDNIAPSLSVYLHFPFTENKSTHPYLAGVLGKR